MNLNLIELFTQAPTIGAILVIVWWFLRALSKRDCTLKEIADRCHDIRTDATAATRENSRVLGETGEVVREAMTLLRKMNGGP